MIKPRIKLINDKWFCSCDKYYAISEDCAEDAYWRWHRLYITGVYLEYKKRSVAVD